jgi:rhomboid protease GluP
VSEIEIKQAGETDKAMNPPKGNMYVTYGIMAINVLMFVLMSISGIDAIAPNAYDLVPWGANYAPLTYHGDWWRLFTCTFLHFGIIHLAMNMYALYFISTHLEPMLGKLRYLAAYICAGILASVASLWWHRNGEVISAGASGAVFGMYGVFLALLTTNLIPKHLRKTLLQSILIFVGYNIFYGFKPNSGIDNAAHLGGLVSGMAIGYIFYPTLKTGSSEKKIQTRIGLVALLTIIIMFASLRGQQNDDSLFLVRSREFAIAEKEALAPYEDNNVTLEELDEVVIPGWIKAGKAIDQMRKYKLNTGNTYTTDQLHEYIELRKKEADLRRKALKENTDEYNAEINRINERIGAIIADLNSKSAK